MVQRCLEHLVPIHSALGLDPDEASIVRLIGVWDRKPEWVTEGYMPVLDAIVVHEVARATQTKTVIEIGTASGVSVCAAVLGLDAVGVLHERAIHTYDCSEQCYFDERRAVGSAAAEMLPDLAHRVTVHRSESTMDASRQHAPGTVGMAIIDGDHRHPMPMIDMALLSCVLAPGAWVVLHDICLSQFEFPHPDGGEPVRYLHTGAEKLFEAWSWEKAKPAPGDYVNIGIVRVPDEGLTPQRIESMLSAVPLDDGITPKHAMWWMEQAGLNQRMPTDANRSSAASTACSKD